MDNFDETQVFEEELAPLMQRMSDICEQHGLPMTVVVIYAKRDGTFTAGVAKDVPGARKCWLTEEVNRFARDGLKEPGP